VSESPLLEVRHLAKAYGAVRAVDGISFNVHAGEAFGIVGETGSGKTTTARMIARLIDPTAGSIHFDGRDLTSLSRGAVKALRREVAMVFQDPYSSLNPRKSAGAIVAEPLAVHGLLPGRGERRRAVGELMERVGLDPGQLHRQPHEFSGGQRQRIGIARALALGPRMIVADEPVSALDVSIQAQILNLLRDLRRDLGLTLVLISHDLSVVRYMCERVAVMRDGQIVESAPAERIFEHPEHEYTRALLDAVPRPVAR
jgi:peptide/nickel transport system ATP-binding protein/oligopeptide transport system ATP-binding protein